MAREEWEAAFYAYRAAQARVNNAAAFLTLTRWSTQVAALRPSVPSSFLVDTTRTVAASRRISRRLAQAWYQYARALDTGYQLGELEDGLEGGTLARVRENFLDRLREAADLGERDSTDLTEDIKRFEQALRDNDYTSPSNQNRRSERLDRSQVDERIREFEESITEDRELEQEEFQWRSDSRPEDLREFIERRLREAAQRETRDRSNRLRIREREGEEVTDEQLLEEHEKAGQVVAGEVHESTADAARKLKEWAYNNDSRVQAVARGTAATPCAFCAMLASRGFAYKSVQTAMTTQNSVQRERAGDYAWVNGFRKVHPNCNCYPIIRWINVPNTALPELNKEFQQLWKDTGNLKAFRAAMYKRNQKLIDQAKSQEE